MNLYHQKWIMLCINCFLIYSCSLWKVNYAVALKQVQIPFNQYNIQTIYHRGNPCKDKLLLNELGIDSAIIFTEVYNFFPKLTINKNWNQHLQKQIKYEIEKNDSTTFEKLHILLGKKINGNYILVIDANNNQQFTDDRIIDLSENYTSPLNNNVNYFTIQKIITQTTNIPNLHPIYGAVNIKMYDRNLLHTIISLGFGMGYSGIFKYKKENLNLLFVRGCCTDSFLNTGYTTIYINNKKSFTNHFIGDTLLLGHRHFLVKSFNDNKPEIKLKLLRGKVNNNTEIQQDSVPQNKIADGSIFHTMQQVSAKDTKDKVIFANYWFANCPPCIAEFPALNKLYATLQGNKNIQFFSFASESVDTIKAFIKRYHIQFPVYAIDSTQTDILLKGMPVYPTNIIYNKKGEEIYLKRGGSTMPIYAEKNMMGTILPLLLKAAETDSIETKNE
ncbi:MAG: TlpA family protein disulfide reductase [Hydrotalea sp. AMD]|nr:MAG: TlpA family protein disulfide reductase [Hydrotalea sp. AMD]